MYTSFFIGFVILLMSCVIVAQSFIIVKVSNVEQKIDKIYRPINDNTVEIHILRTELNTMKQTQQENKEKLEKMQNQIDYYMRNINQ